MDMKVLMLYFSLGGRTKIIAECISERLNNSDVRIEQLEYTKKKRDFLSEQDEVMKGDLSGFKYNEDIKDLAVYDLILLGFPTHGGRPATVFNAYFEHAQNVKGKNFIIFNTCRFSLGKTFEIMQAVIEQKRGSVVKKQAFKGFFKIKMSKVEEFVKELNQEFMKPS
jgi:flavodoxin